MKQFRKQFGDRVADALAKCPTLVEDLAEIRSRGVTIRKVGGHCQAYSMLSKMTIYIGARCKLSEKLIALAHEKVHLLVSPTPNPTPRVSSRQAFIDMCLDAETDAIVHEVVVANELLAAGYEVDDHSMSWVRRFKRGGRDAIRRAMEKAFTSTTGEKYPEYYGGWYDEVVKPKDRLPFRQFTDAVIEINKTSPTPQLNESALDIDFAKLLARAVSAGGRALSAGSPAARDGRDRCPRFACRSDSPVRPALCARSKRVRSR